MNPVKTRYIFIVGITTLAVLCFLNISCKRDKEIIEEPKTFGDLSGIIQNEFKQAIANATIKIGTLSVESDLNGSYSFSKLLTNEYDVSVSKEFYLTKIQKISITTNNVSKLDFVLSAGKSYLSIPDSIFTVPVKSGTLEVAIQSNASWLIANTENWVKCPTSSGAGTAKLTLSYSENEGLFDRTDTIKISSGAIKRKIVIRQPSPLRLLEQKGIVENGDKGIADSVALLFNKPVTVKTISTESGNCTNEIKPQITQKGCRVTFSYACAKLGGDYPFFVSVVDANGNSLTQNIRVRFYKSKLNLPGIITDYLLINDETEALLSTTFPAKLIRYSIAQDKVLQTVDLSATIMPLSLCFNPYNSKVYIVGADPASVNYLTYQFVPDIYTFDLITGKMKKAVTVKTDQLDHPDYPTNLPYKLGFTKSGYGIVCLKAQASSTLRWKLIDSQHNDSIYNYQYDNESDSRFLFENAYLNFDQTKLYMLQAYGSNDYGIFEGNTQRITIFRPPSVTRGVYITPYKKSDKFYAGQLYDQFVVDLKGNMSKLSYMKMSGSSSDFSYRKNEDNIIYYCSYDYLQVLDYNTAKTLMWCDNLTEFMKFTSTVNGENAIVYTNNSDGTSSLIVFDTTSFYENIK